MAGPVLDRKVVQDLIEPHTDFNTVQILDLSRKVVASKLGIAPDAYSPTLQGDLLSILPNLTSLLLQDYSKRGYIIYACLCCSDWSSVDLFTESKSLRKLDLRGNRVEVSSTRRLLSLLPGMHWLCH